MKPTAKYRCIKCGHDWEGEPGPTDCPACDHKYVKWINYTDYWKDLDQKADKVSESVRKQATRRRTLKDKYK